MEIEVARRLEERLKEKEREEAERRKKEDQRAEASSSSLSRSPSKKNEGHSLPPGVLTPLLKKHRDLDDELKLRLQELERKLYVHTIPLPGNDHNLLSASAEIRKYS